MSALKNHQLYYDTDCPLCVAYTGAMEKHHLLATGTRTPFQQISPQTLVHIDAKRAISEIALRNLQNGKVHYGIDAMLQILFRENPFLMKLFKRKPLYFLLKHLYGFISYNRKVIAPAPAETGQIACVPPLRKSYRLAYIAFVFVLSSIVLTNYYGHLDTWMGLNTFPLREWYSCAGQLIWQGLALYLFVPSGRRWDYIGNMITVSLIGTLLLLPVLWLGNLFGLPPAYYFAGFMGVVVFMLWEHMRRVRLLKMPGWLSASWVLYRIVWAAGLLFL